MDSVAKLLIKFPSRGRPEKFFRSLDSVANNVYDKRNYHISCTIDEDDELMNNQQVLSRLETYSNVSIGWGLSDSKIHAVNRTMPEIDWDIVAVLSDDILFSIYGFDEIIRNEMKSSFPEGDGYLHFKEQDSQEFLNVMTVIDRAYYNRFGYIYHPSYKSLWCDNEQTEVAKILGRYKYIPYEIFEHRNPAYHKYNEVRDEMFNRQQADWTEDETNFHKRKAINFEL